MLGQWLVDQQLITDQTLELALEQQLLSGGRLGDILIAMGATTPYQLYPALAQQLQLPFVDLLKQEFDTSTLSLEALPYYIHLRMLPIGLVPGSRVMRIASAEPLDYKVKQFCYDHYPEGVEMHVTSPLDIRRAIEQHFADTLIHESSLGLAELMPQHSARKRLSSLQIWLLLVLVSFYATTLYMDSYATAALTLLVAHMLYAVALAFKTLVFVAGLTPIKRPIADQPVNDKDLPSFTILVPLYKEVAALPKLLTALKSLNYPTQKLDIKLILEADDTPTYEAAIALKPSYQFDIIRVPPSQPRTKPKACNYALAFARGDIVTIYDAEDIPDPMQLRKVVALFDTADESVNTVQAKLRYYNANKNLLTRFFDIEYAILFEHLLYGLERLHIPIPLGGTSNHINALRFREMGHWDPFNVTEDADLGIRFAASGMRTNMIDSTTMEEAPSDVWSWMRQRSRWMKGHIQTWLVHNRRPRRLIRTIGLGGYLGFNLFLGLPYLLYLTAPFILALSYMWGEHGYFKDMLPASLSCLMAFNLGFFLITHWLQALWVYRKKLLSLRAWAAIILFPGYWLLHIITSFKALWQLVFKPFYWEKTEHGS